MRRPTAAELICDLGPVYGIARGGRGEIAPATVTPDPRLEGGGSLGWSGDPDSGLYAVSLPFQLGGSRGVVWVHTQCAGLGRPPEIAAFQLLVGPPVSYATPAFPSGCGWSAGRSQHRSTTRACN